MELQTFLSLANAKHALSSLKQYIRHPDFFSKPKGMAPQTHAKMVDTILGFHIPKVERNLEMRHGNYDKVHNQRRRDDYQEHHTWIGLKPQVLLTPYSDFVDILQHLPLNKMERIVDFGAAYGRLGIVMASVASHIQFVGYEIVEKRIDEGMRLYQRLELDRANIYLQDITSDDFSIPLADAYFVYDFGEQNDLKILLNKLLKVAESRPICLIARGEFMRQLIDTRYPSFRNSVTPIQGKFWTIYQTAVIPSST